MRPPTLEAAGQPAKSGMKLPIAPVSALNVRVLFAFDYPISIGLPTRLFQAIRLSHLSSVASSVDLMFRPIKRTKQHVALAGFQIAPRHNVAAISRVVSHQSH